MSAQLQASFTTQGCALKAASEYHDYMVQLTVSALENPNSTRVGIDMVCVLDRSGSMAGRSIELLKQTMEYIADYAQPIDRVGIVLFDCTSSVLLPLTAMDENGKLAASKAIQSIRTRGSTALCQGLCDGVNMMRNRVDANEVAAILLFTDGHANVGPTKYLDILRSVFDPDFLTSFKPPSFPSGQALQGNMMDVMGMISNTIAPFFGGEDIQEDDTEVEVGSFDLSGHHFPCALHTFGFGNNHDEKLLSRLADYGNGQYFYIRNSNDIAGSFGDCVGGLMSTVARNIHITLEPSSLGVKVASLKTKYAHNIEEDFTTIKLSDLQSGENRDIMVYIDIPSLSSPSPIYPLLSATVVYDDLVAECSITLETVCSVRRGEDEELAVPIEMSVQVNRFIAADAMTQAAKVAQEGEMERARGIIQNAIHELEISPSKDEGYVQRLVVELGESLEGLRDHIVYHKEGGKHLTSNAMAHYQQRSNNIGSDAQACYQNLSRKKASKFFSKCV